MPSLVPPEWVADQWDYQDWVNRLLHDLGAHVEAADGFLAKTEVVRFDGEVVGFEFLRKPEQVIRFWVGGRRIVFDMLVDLEGMQIERAHFVLRRGDEAEPPGEDDVLVRICRDETYVGWLGSAWHEHKGSDGQHEARPEWEDWDLEDVLTYLHEY